MAKDVKFNIKLSIDGKEHIVEATTDVKHFAQELGIAETKGKRLRDSLLKFNGLVTMFQGLQSSIQQVTGVAQTYIDANKIQVEAETKLMTVMKQRMNATLRGVGKTGLALRFVVLLLQAFYLHTTELLLFFPTLLFGHDALLLCPTFLNLFDLPIFFEETGVHTH